MAERRTNSQAEPWIVFCSRSRFADFRPTTLLSIRGVAMPVKSRQPSLGFGSGLRQAADVERRSPPGVAESLVVNGAGQDGEFPAGVLAAAGQEPEEQTIVPPVVTWRMPAATSAVAFLHRAGRIYQDFRFCRLTPRISNRTEVVGPDEPRARTRPKPVRRPWVWAARARFMHSMPETLGRAAGNFEPP